MMVRAHEQAGLRLLCVILFGVSLLCANLLCTYLRMLSCIFITPMQQWGAFLLAKSWQLPGGFPAGLGQSL